MSSGRTNLRRLGWAGLALSLGLLAATGLGIDNPLPAYRRANAPQADRLLLDRHGLPLAVSYRSAWNHQQTVPLHAIPDLLQQAVRRAEDRRFFQHSGTDWLARGHALWQRLRYGRQHSRGASSLTEQIIRMLHPRPRSLWSKWLEGWEAVWLERQVGKGALLEFYLNQVPYASQRRGVAQAARWYFNRDLTTLSPCEMLALAVLIRAPSRFDLRHGEVKIDRSIRRLAEELIAEGQLDPAWVRSWDEPLRLEASSLPVEAPHFIRQVRQQLASRNLPGGAARLTTLDSGLQAFAQSVLEERLAALQPRGVGHAAVLVADHQRREILAWVSLGHDCRRTQGKAPGCQLDMVTRPRQPGSALKPFLYAAALEKGWTAASLIDDSPYADTIGRGIHHFRNYSGQHYGKVPLRSALGNSLNIPALHTIHDVGVEAYLKQLHRFGFASLNRPADYYDEGLALGSGEVTLLELVEAYAALARQGRFAPLQLLLQPEDRVEERRVISAEAATLIGHILADPWARQWEFGAGSILNLPTETAVKTGTSTDYRDAWALGYTHRYVVGIWMGNADYRPMDGVTGSLGPALALRSLFSELDRRGQSAPLPLSPRLTAAEVCLPVGGAEDSACTRYTEYFLPEHPYRKRLPETAPARITLARPAPHLQLAIDPRIPAGQQAFAMRLSGVTEGDEVRWWLDGQPQPPRQGPEWLWPPVYGKHRVRAEVWREGRQVAVTPVHQFEVR